MISEAFVYCWTDHLTNKLYVGSHKGSIDDGYICSSKLMMEQYNIRPQDFTRQIVAEGSFEDIRKLEAKILDSVDAKLDEQFYNQHNGNGNFYLKGHTKEYKVRQSKLLKGKKKKISEKCRKPKSEEHKKALSLSKKGKKKSPFSESHKKNMRLSRKKYIMNNRDKLFGKKHSEKTKEKISIKKSQKWIVETPLGQFLTITNLREFCLKNQLNETCMYKVAKGKKPHHKKYKVKMVVGISSKNIISADIGIDVFVGKRLSQI